MTDEKFKELSATYERACELTTVIEGIAGHIYRLKHPNFPFRVNVYDAETNAYDSEIHLSLSTIKTIKAIIIKGLDEELTRLKAEFEAL